MSAGSGTTQFDGKKSAPTLLPPVPDFLGKDVRVVAVSDMLEQAQRQHLQYSQMRLVNNDDLEDPIPLPDGRLGEETYGKRLEQLETGIRLLLADNEDIAEELAEEAHTRRKKWAKERAAAA